MYRIAFRQRRALKGCYRTFINGNNGAFGSDLVTGSNRFFLSRHYATGQSSKSFTGRVASTLLRTTGRVANKLLRITGVVIMSGGIVLLVRCALIRILN